MLKKSENRYFFFILVLIITFFLIGCKPKEIKISSVDTKDITFLKDSKGLPMAVKLVSEVTLEGKEGSDVSYSCKLNYVDEFVGIGSDFKVKISEKEKTTNTVTLLNPIEGKLDIARWKICCDLKSSKDFNAKTQTTVCSK